MENKYEHLFEKETIECEWETNILKKSLPARAFTNNLTSNLLLSCEAMLSASMKPIERIHKFFSI